MEQNAGGYNIGNVNIEPRASEVLNQTLEEVSTTPSDSAEMDYGQNMRPKMDDQGSEQPNMVM